jgi:hypothetical protein
VRTLPPAAAVLDTVVAEATAAEEILVFDSLGMGEETTRPRREMVKIDVEKRIVLNVLFYFRLSKIMGL